MGTWIPRVSVNHVLNGILLERLSAITDNDREKLSWKCSGRIAGKAGIYCLRRAEPTSRGPSSHRILRVKSSSRPLLTHKNCLCNDLIMQNYIVFHSMGAATSVHRFALRINGSRCDYSKSDSAPDSTSQYPTLRLSRM